MECFDRDSEVAALWRHFKKGRSILMLAPRRTGKTVLLERLKNESSGHGYQGIMLDVEGFTEEKDFFRQLCASIQKQIGIGKSLLGALGARLKQVTAEPRSQPKIGGTCFSMSNGTGLQTIFWAQLEADKDQHDWLRRRRPRSSFKPF